MTSITAATSNTLTAMLGSIATVANTAQRTVVTAASTLDMIDTYVESARKRQLKSTEKAMLDFEADLEIDILKAAVERAHDKKRIQSTLASDPALTKLFTEDLARYSAFLAPQAKP